MNQYYAYNTSIKQRGALSTYLNDDVLANWRAHGRGLSRKYRFSEECIRAMMVVKVVYKLGYREAEGLVRDYLVLRHFFYDP